MALQVLTRPASRYITRSVLHQHSGILSIPSSSHRWLASLSNNNASIEGSAQGTPNKDKPLANSPPIVIPTDQPGPSRTGSTNGGLKSEERLLETSQPGSAPSPPSKQRARPTLRARTAAMTLTPTAVSRVRSLLAGPNPQYIRVGVRNKGCAGMSYHLEYVDKPGKFDEKVEQDGVTVLIDSKALFSIIGSEMDWVTDRLSSKFAFTNPNIKDACGCGESFNVQPGDAQAELAG